MAASLKKLRAAATVVAAGVILLAAAGCKKDDGAPKDPVDLDDPLALAEDGTESTAPAIDTEIVTSSLVSATASSGSLTLASTRDFGAGGIASATFGAAVKAIYFPQGCVSVTSDDATKTVTYGFADCAGPHGIFKIRGTIKATYATAPGKLTLDLVGTDLLVNRSTADWTAHAEITATGLQREMRWKGTLEGTTARGKTFSQTNDKVLTWRFGERCFGVSGVSEGKVRDRYLRTEVTDFRRCQGGCPEAGGRITISNANKLKVDISFDGTNVATVATPKGTKTVDLACQG